MPEEICWGCGRDYLHFWAEDDLVSVTVDGITAKVCPDCYDELQRQDRIIEE